MELYKNLQKIFFLSLCMLLVFSCNKDEDPVKEKGKDSDRQLMLQHIADEIVIPSYSNFKVKMDVMVAKSQSFSLNPTSEGLIELRTAWVDAYVEWQKVELFDFGPAYNHVLRSYINIYPANVTGINSNITNLPSLPNLDVPDSYPSQGFPALDYLINGLSNNDIEILSYYTSAPDAENRIAYLLLITGKMKSRFDIVNAEWNGGYRNEFVNNTSMDMSGSTSLVVNGYVLNYERFIRSGKFGIPSGALAGGATFPEQVEAFYKKDISLILAKTAHQASIDFFNGKSVKTGMEGPSLKTYLNSLGKTPLIEKINEQFGIVNDKMNLLSGDLYNEVINNKQAMINVFDAMQVNVSYLKVDMTSAMSITITYTDNDGD